MGGIPKLFNTGRSGLMAARGQLSTTGHNISNVNTDGYSRQKVVQKTGPSVMGYGGHTYGTGAMVADVHRVHDDFIERKIIDQNKHVGFSEESEILLNETTGIFNEANSEGMNKIISRFFNSWRELANDPVDEAKRTVLRSNAELMSRDFKRIYKQLHQATETADARIRENVRVINSSFKHIADLNHSIRSFELKGGNSSDLKDQRDLALRKLSSLIDVSVAETEKGEFIVNAKDIGPVVVGAKNIEFEVMKSPADQKGKREGALDVRVKDAPREPITHVIRSGKLGGLLSVRDDVISKAFNKVDELAYRIVNEVNYIHRQGVAKDGVKGRDFFRAIVDPSRASSFVELSEDVFKSNDNIAAGLMPNKPSDNRVANAIASIQYKKVFGDGTTDFDTYYDGIVTDVAVKANKAKLEVEQQGAILRQLEEHRDSLSGVSLDEEAANLVQMQHTFNANAKVLKTADEMLQEIINMVS
jgi:flagellar hook-associated protein 1 FlgK